MTTVSGIDFDGDDSEVWQSIDNEMSDDEIVLGDGERDYDAEESAINVIRSQRMGVHLHL